VDEPHLADLFLRNAQIPTPHFENVGWQKRALRMGGLFVGEKKMKFIIPFTAAMRVVILASR